MDGARRLHYTLRRRVTAPMWARLWQQGRRPRMAREPRILVMGWYGVETVGDKAILASLLAEIGDAGSVALATCDVEGSRRTLEDIAASHVRCVSNRLPVLARELCQTDLVIIGGGPLTGWGPMELWADLLEMARRLGCKVMVYGCGIGPVDSPATAGAIARLLGAADVITLRDEASVAQAARLGIDEARVTLAADPAFGFARPAKSPSTRGGRLRIGISLRSFPESCFVATASEIGHSAPEVAASVRAAVVTVARELVARGDVELVLVPMQTHPDDDDRPLLEAVGEEIGGPGRVAHGLESPADVLGEIGALDVMIGMRFHSVVFSLMTDTPVIGIDYDMHGGKVTGVMQAAGLSDFLIPIGQLTETALRGALTRILADRVGVASRIRVVAPELRRRESQNGARMRLLLGIGENEQPGITQVVGRAGDLVPRLQAGEVVLLRQGLEGQSLDWLLDLTFEGMARAGHSAAASYCAEHGIERVHEILDPAALPEVTEAVYQQVSAVAGQVLRRFVPAALGYSRPFYFEASPNVRFHYPYDRVAGSARTFGAFTKLHGQGKITAHGPHRDPWLDCPVNAVNVWIAVGPVQPGNGLAIFPTLFDAPLSWGEDGHVRARGPLPAPVTVAMEPGDVLLFSGRHLHASELNTTPSTRCVISFRLTFERPHFAGAHHHRYLRSDWSVAPTPLRSLAALPALFQPSYPRHRIRSWLKRRGLGGDPQARAEAPSAPAAPRSLEDLPIGVPLALDGGRCAVRDASGELFVVQRRCPHQGADLALGRLENGRLVCPWHNLAFDLRTGQSACATIPPLRKFPNGHR